MIVRHQIEDLATLGAPLHLALGVFDGVHVGHQEVIARAVRAAKRDGGLAGVVTFDPHPIRVIAPNKAPSALLATLDHKAQIVGELGVEVFLAVHFNEAFAAMEAGDFLEKLLQAPIHTIAVGEDWRFGKGRHGDVELLQQQADVHGFTLEAVPPVMLDGERVSSTRIRQAIRDGNLEAAARMIGRPYSVSGKVVEGRKLGRTIGFPTANVSTGDAQLPPDGVWAVTVRIPAHGEIRGVANLGLRPTVDGTHRVLEVHLFDFSNDLYGKEIEVEFRRYIRPEMKFGGIEELREQIARDVRNARENSGS